MKEKSRLPDFGRSRAVLLAVGTFKDPDLGPLPAALNNVRALYELLTDDRISGFTSDQCIAVLNPSDPGGLFQPVKEAADSAEDLFLVYYSGHGIINSYNGELHLALTETVQDDTWTSADVMAMASLIKKSRARCKVVILDCCFSGRALDQLMTEPVQIAADQLDVDGLYALASSSASKPSFSDGDERYTRFTGAMLGVAGAGIVGAGELLSMDELFGQVRAKVRPIPHQRINNNAGHVALVRNRAYRKRDDENDSPAELDHKGSTAILVGTTSFADGSFPPLPSCRSDLASMEEILTDPAICGVPTERSATILDPVTFDDVLEPLHRLALDAHGTIFLYLTGHLILSHTGEPHLAISQSQHGKPWTWLPISFIIDVLSESPARSSVIIADTCYAGRIANSMTSAGGNFGLLAASTSTSMAFIRDGRGVFTDTLVGLLRRGLPRRPVHLTLLDVFQGLREASDETLKPTLSVAGLRELECLFNNRSSAAYVGPHLCPRGT